MSDACAAAPAKKPQFVNVITDRDEVVNYIDHSTRAQQLLVQRLAIQGPGYAYRQAVRDYKPGLAASLEEQVAEAVERVMKARLPRRIKRVHRARRIAA